jgi:hypothetical protein
LFGIDHTVATGYLFLFWFLITKLIHILVGLQNGFSKLTNNLFYIPGARWYRAKEYYRGKTGTNLTFLV